MLRVGQMVKNVREPGFVGLTGRVEGFDVNPLNDGECDIVIRVDGGGIDAQGGIFFAGELVDSEEKFWEPLTPPHEACDPEFAESIRRLTDWVSA